MFYKLNILLFSGIICFNNYFVNCDEISDLIDLSCKTTNDCSQFSQAFHNITCLDSKCTCFNENFQNIECTPPKTFYNNIIGGSCPCSIENSECNTHSEFCFCKKGFVTTLDKRRCIKKTLQLGENCENNSQCIYQEKFSECHMEEKICKCQKDFVEFNKGCVSTVNLEEHCENDEQCNNKTIHSVCAFKKCACNFGFVSNLEKTKCLPGVGHNNDCIQDNQCKLVLGVGSLCYSGKCSCDDRHELLGLESKQNNEISYTCEKRINFGDYCYEHNDCYHYKEIFGQQAMECFNGECKCRPDFINTNNTCVFNGAETAKINMFSMILMIITCMLLSTLLNNSIEKIYDL